MFVAEHEVEIRYAETDQMGVVYHSNYLVWLELGRTKLIQDLGFSYVEMEKEGIISPVLDLQISYRKAMRYGEKAIVKTWVDTVSRFALYMDMKYIMVKVNFVLRQVRQIFVRKRRVQARII